MALVSIHNLLVAQACRVRVHPECLPGFNLDGRVEFERLQLGKTLSMRALIMLRPLILILSLSLKPLPHSTHQVRQPHPSVLNVRRHTRRTKKESERPNAHVHGVAWHGGMRGLTPGADQTDIGPRPPRTQTVLTSRYSYGSLLAERTSNMMPANVWSMWSV